MFLYLIVGSDNVLRVWDIKTQELFHQEESSRQGLDFPDVLSFTERWSNDDRLFGMLYTSQEKGEATFVQGL